jgi:hypothetical protein
MKEIIKCMVCDNSVKTELPHEQLSLQEKAWLVARHENWAMGQGKYGIFICCPDCYPLAFDRSKGGSVGFLRAEYEKYATKQ